MSQPLPSLNIARHWHGAAVVTPSNHVFVVGGEGADPFLDSVERLTDGSAAWEERAGLAIPTARDSCGVCAVGTLLVTVGGRTDQSQECDIVEAVDTVSGDRTVLPPCPSQLFGCGVTSWEGKVVVTGGQEDLLSTNNVWALDVGNGNDLHKRSLRWASLPAMAGRRYWHGATAGDGRIFVCGGFYNGPLSSCEVLRLGGGQGEWEDLPPMPTALQLVGCCFGGGNVFVAGGNHNAEQAVLALSVGQREWRQVAELRTPRSGCAAVCVGRRVLVLGGYNDDDGHLRNCEQFLF